MFQKQKRQKSILFIYINIYIVQVISVDPDKADDDSTHRVKIECDTYKQLVFYDHWTRKKNN